MRIAITGSNGFIGNELTNHLLRQGHEVFLMQRQPPTSLLPNSHYIPYDLNQAPLLPEIPHLDAVVHTAYIPFSKTNSSTQKNVEGTLALYNYCRINGIHFTFLSSLSAHEDALSEYGKHKFNLENKLDSASCLILKLGMVTGERGLYSRIKTSLKKSPILFLIGGGQQPVQPVTVEVVVLVITNSILIKRTGIFFLASPKISTLKEMMYNIATSSGKKPLFIPIPYWLAQFGICLVETLRLPFPVSNENLLGLKQLRAFDTQKDWELLVMKTKNQ